VSDKVKKILFVNMPNTVMDDYELARYVLERRTVSNIPYGLLSLCSYLKQYSASGAEPRILDLNDEMWRAYHDKDPNPGARVYAELIREIEHFGPDLVGISIMFSVSYRYLDAVVARVKGIDKRILVTVGGNLATSLYEEILVNENIDNVCYGEGEIPFCGLVDSDDILKYIAETPAFITREKIRSGRQPVNLMVEELDSLPPIDFGFIDLSGYRGPLTRFFQRDKHNHGEDQKTLIIYTTRGCPYRCCFCAAHVVHGKKVRCMSVDKALSDVRLMIQEHDITCLMVNDDNFLFQKDRAKAILRGLRELNLKVVFPSLLMRNIDDDIALLLKQVGVTNQLVSIESGSEYVLENIIRKPLSKEEIFIAVQNLKRHGISVDTNVVTGFPGETDEHRQETLKTIYDAGFNWSHFLIALPLPGSSLYRQCKENGYLVDYDVFHSPSLSKCCIRTPDYDPEHIQEQAYLMNLHANFVHNYNLRAGNYDECIRQFGHIIELVPNHALAFYGLMKAYEGKVDWKNAESNRIRFLEIVGGDSFWRGHAEHFGLMAHCQRSFTLNAQ
jgi:anaerobic magnesium-protoporphyrin IX monomethyl ester cyclase